MVIENPSMRELPEPKEFNEEVEIAIYEDAFVDITRGWDDERVPLKRLNLARQLQRTLEL